MEIKNQRALATLLARLRKGNLQQSGLTEDLIPPSKEIAYRVANLVERELGWDVKGWKIAALIQKCSERFALTRQFMVVYIHNL